MAEIFILTNEDAQAFHLRQDQKLNLIIAQQKTIIAQNQQLIELQQRGLTIMSKLSDDIALINSETNDLATSTAATATAVQTAADEIAKLRARLDNTASDADLAALDSIAANLGGTKTSLDATTARLLAVAADPNNVVPTAK